MSILSLPLPTLLHNFVIELVFISTMGYIGVLVHIIIDIPAPPTVTARGAAEEPEAGAARPRGRSHIDIAYRLCACAYRISSLDLGGTRARERVLHISAYYLPLLKYTIFNCVL